MIKSTQSNVMFFEPTSWSHKAAGLIFSTITSVAHSHGSCNVLLTGGDAAQKVYVSLAQSFDIRGLKNVHFYFGDERSVQPDEKESNYGMVMRSLFSDGVPLGCSLHRMEAEARDRFAAADRYAALMPEDIDVLLLGVGEDGHIASLFPHGPGLRENHRKVIPCTGPKPPYQRLTITPTVILRAKATFVLAPGAGKAAVLLKAQSATDVEELPACLVIGATWLLDVNLFPQVYEANKEDLDCPKY